MWGEEELEQGEICPKNSRIWILSLSWCPRHRLYCWCTPTPNKWPEVGIRKHSSAGLLCLLKFSSMLEGCVCGAWLLWCRKWATVLERSWLKQGCRTLRDPLLPLLHLVPVPCPHLLCELNRLAVNPLPLNSPSLWSPMKSWRLLPLPTSLLFSSPLLQLWKGISSTETQVKLSFVRRENWCWPSLSLNWPVIKRKYVVQVIFNSDMLTNF